MLTRSRFGFANENAVNGVKGSLANQKSTKNAVQTRSRAVLGDVRNRNLDSHKNVKKPPETKKNEKCSANAAEAKHEKIAEKALPSQLEIFRRHRRELRNNLPKMDYLECEALESGDVAAVYPYTHQIFNYLQNRELSVQPLIQEFLTKECEINPRMRYILVNWLVEIHHSYKLQPETLYLCVAILDRYLQKNTSTIKKDSFQLVGITALFIAAKFEEMYPPDIGDFTAVTHNAFTKHDIRNCEQTILQSIDFFLSIPIPLVFLRRLSRAIEADRNMHNLAKYFLELTVQEYDLTYLTGNHRAVACLCLSRALFMQTATLEDAWCDTMTYMSGYNVDDVKETIKLLARAAYRQNSPSKYRAIFNKYRSDDFYGRVAALPHLRSSLMETLADLQFDSDGETNPSGK